MDKIYRAEWLKRLRSGDYEQGVGNLRSGDGEYCCLGVLAEIGAEKGEVKSKRCDIPNCGCSRTIYDDSTGHLSMNFMEIVDISGKSADLLITMNDTARKTFGEIADWIEANL